MNSDASLASQSGIVRFDVADNAALLKAYMPFIQNGGLFVPQRYLAEIRYDLGSDVFLLLHLVFQDERIPIAGKVVWITPRATQRPQGIGIQFSASDGGATQGRLETLLAGQLNDSRESHTL